MLDMDNTISHLESNNKSLRAQIEQMEQEYKSSAQSNGGQINHEAADEGDIDGLNQELIDSQIEYKASQKDNLDILSEDIINTNNPIDNDARQFEPFIQINVNEDNDDELEFATIDPVEVEAQRKEILKKCQTHPFKIICDPQLPNEQTYVGRQQAYDLIFEKLNSALKNFYNNKYHKNKN